MSSSTNVTNLFLLISSILFIFATFAEQTYSISFEIVPGSKKCLKEEMRKNLLAVGEYTISPSSGAKTDFQITDSKGHTALLRTNIDGKGKFAVTSDEDDIYDICFDYPQPGYGVNAVRREITLDIRLGVEAKQNDPEYKNKLDKLEADLTDLEALTDSIIEDFVHLKKRESEMQDTNKSTSDRIFWQTVISILVVIGLAGWQSLFLRQFFRSRKLID